MKLMCDDDVPAPPAVESYQETAWPALGVGLALVVWALAEQGWRVTWPLAFFGPMALIVLPISRFALRSFLAGRRPESWRLRKAAEGIYLR